MINDERIFGEDLADLGSKAIVVGRDREEFDAAKKEKAEALARLFERVVDVVRPALRACSSRIARQETRHQGAATSEREHFFGPSARGVYLPSKAALARSGNPMPGPQFGDEREQKLGGVDHFLLEDGHVLRVEYDGELEARDGLVGWWWRGTGEMLEVAEAVERGLDVPRAVESIADAVRRAYEGREIVRTDQVREETEKVRAIVALLGGMR